MQAGQLRHMVRIQNPVRTADGQGGYNVTWQTASIVHAGIFPLSTQEFLSLGEKYPKATHRVRVRYTDDLKAHSRILFGARELYLQGTPTNRTERGIELEAICEEKSQ